VLLAQVREEARVKTAQDLDAEGDSCLADLEDIRRLPAARHLVRDSASIPLEVAKLAHDAPGLEVLLEGGLHIPTQGRMASPRT